MGLLAAGASIRPVLKLSTHGWTDSLRSMAKSASPAMGPWLALPLARSEPEKLSRSSISSMVIHIISTSPGSGFYPDSTLPMKSLTLPDSRSGISTFML